MKEAARFARLRTVGAFLVSGEIRPGGRTSYLAVTSEAGRECHLVRPWEGQVRVRLLGSLEGVPFTEETGVLIFPTEAGSTYIVDRPEAPWEEMPDLDVTML